MNNKKIIEVNNLVKKYGEFTAVKGISFEVFEGEIFGLLGPNGAGKSTTLEIIETLRDKTEGKVTVGGYDLDKNPEDIKKIIGVQLQSSGYYPGLNLVELIEMFGGLYNQAVEPLKLLAMFNLEDKAKAKFKELSGGQKQRIMLARALAINPKILILDDFTARVDAPTEVKILKNVQQNYPGITLISVTQKITSVEHFDQVLLLMEGEMLAKGTHDELMSSSPEYVQIYNSQQSTSNYELQPK